MSFTGSMAEEVSENSKNFMEKLMELTYILNEYDMSKQAIPNFTSDSLINNNNNNSTMNNHLSPSPFNGSFQSQCGLPTQLELIAESMFRGMTSNQQDISNNNYQPTNNTSVVPSISGKSSSSSQESITEHVEKFQVNVQVKSSAHVSYIVGKQGSKIRQIRQETDTLIHTPVNGEEPMFILKGRKKNVIEAKERILAEAKQYDMSLFMEAINYQDGNKKQLNLLLPSRFIGLVVGKKGAAIKRIMEQSGATIVTPKVNTLNGFKVFGTLEQIRKAIDLIKQHIEGSSKVTIMEIDKNNCEVELYISSKQ